MHRRSYDLPRTRKRMSESLTVGVSSVRRDETMPIASYGRMEEIARAPSSGRKAPDPLVMRRKDLRGRSIS